MNPHDDLVPALVSYINARLPGDWPAGMTARHQLENDERTLPALVVTIQNDERQHPLLSRVTIGFDFILKATDTRATALTLVRGLHSIIPDPRAFLLVLNDPLQNPDSCRIAYRRWWWQGTETEIDGDRGNWTHRILAQCFIQTR